VLVLNKWDLAEKNGVSEKTMMEELRMAGQVLELCAGADRLCRNGRRVNRVFQLWMRFMPSTVSASPPVN